MLTRKCSAPIRSDLVAAKRVLRCLRVTKHWVLRIYRIAGALTKYSDADWGNEVAGRKFISGIVVKIGMSTVFWRSKKQGCVSLSTSEAEFIALSDATQHLVWMRAMLNDLGCGSENPTVLFSDNAGSLWWEQCTKHVEAVETHSELPRQLFL